MMHGFGDCSEPLIESAKIIEDVVLQQMRTIVNKAYEGADRRGSHTVTAEDFIFLLRKDKVKLQRLIKYLELKDFKATMKKTIDTDPIESALESDNFDKYKVAKKSYHNFVSLIDVNGELLKSGSTVDYVKQNRSLRAEMMTRKMDETRYIEFSKARRVSFANSNRHKFSDWVCSDGDINISKQGYVVLGYLAYETVAQIVDLAFIVRQDQNKIHGDAIDRLRLSYFNPYTYKPYQHNKGVITKAITPAEINEALRRYWSPQLDISGPFHRSSMRRQHPKLLSC
ncbi:transcription initiation protein SPT3 homolog isoform X2 [Cephus cinctus]|nr:transcription initiation protein SPT3 homolog isoform X2 [Cephus cinctus]